MEEQVFAGSWSELNTELSQSVKDVLAKFGFDQMTPVQSATIPLFLQHKDVAVEACTGSGKTLAFAIPIIEMVIRHDQLKSDEVCAIVIEPTRELALQVSAVMKHFVEALEGVSMGVYIGGTEMEEDVRTFNKNGANIIIATPGRLNHMFTRLENSFLKKRVSNLDLLVLDEADRLLDLGFESEVNSILSMLPKQRRTGLFSATQTREVTELTRAGLRNPVAVIVETKSEFNSSQQVPTSLDNSYIMSENAERLNHLVHFISETAKTEKIIVYMLTCGCVDYFSLVLPKISSLHGLNIMAMHGRMPQKKRMGLLQEFSEARCGVLLATDVAARGLDLPNVNWVVQFDPPQDPSMYVHRCGRTARLGRAGSAILFLREKEDTYIEFLKLRKVPISPYTSFPSKVTDILPEIRDIALKDRSVFEKSQVAFVSYIRGYREHRCSQIFRFKDMDVCAMANGFGLIRIPRMPELKASDSLRFVPPENVDFSAIPYLDKARESARQERLKRQLENGSESSKKRRKKKESFSEQKEKKQKRQERRDKRQNKRESKQRSAQLAFEQTLDDDELNDLNTEARALKKLKKGMITEDEFDSLVGDLGPEPFLNTEQSTTPPAKNGNAPDDDGSKKEMKTDDAILNADIVSTQESGSHDLHSSTEQVEETLRKKKRTSKKKKKKKIGRLC